MFFRETASIVAAKPVAGLMLFALLPPLSCSIYRMSLAFVLRYTSSLLSLKIFLLSLIDFVCICVCIIVVALALSCFLFRPSNSFVEVIQGFGSGHRGKDVCLAEVVSILSLFERLDRTSDDWLETCIPVLEYGQNFGRSVPMELNSKSRS
ncbi:uncharacterized protein LY89DRAFT_266297 [Mollisia scopiformis]|uniref:Uncharacterized protein n=1 Tax=Mollisia scopiformis TaxID=149040 RepID=A0A132BC13_MOLSC|nr:uncharacterized protein LY89DRAFT_266297 [Mollisia scopiformis]KUJ09918.1 hypothetical protein LY89DRAFT_266297 [Mollisia scopiformis]